MALYALVGAFFSIIFIGPKDALSFARLEQFPHLDRDQFVTSLSKDEQLKEDITESRRIGSGTKSKTIADEEVGEWFERGVQVNTPHVFFTASDYRKVFKCAPPVGKKAATISMPSDDTSSEEKLWFFRDDGSDIPGPHKKGFLFQRKLLHHDVRHMPIRHHRVKRQAGRVIQHHLKDKGYQAMASTKVLTLAQEFERLQANAQDSDDAAEIIDVLRTTNCSSAESAGRGGAHDARSEAQDSEARPSTPSKSKASVLDALPSSRVDRSPDDCSPGAAASEAGGLCKMTIAGSVCGSDGEDDEADFNGDDVDAMVAFRVKSMDLSKALMDKRLGNQERRFSELLTKLGKEPQTNAAHLVVLRNHSKLFDAAKATSMKLMSSLSPEQFRKNAEMMKKAKVVFEPGWKTAVFNKALNWHLEKFISSENAADLAGLLKSVKPWTDSDDATEFDPCAPTLASLEAAGQKKIITFQRSVMEKAFIPLLTAGEDKAQIVTDFASVCLGTFESIPVDLELNEASTQVVLDALTIWRAILTLSKQWIDLEASSEDQEAAGQAVLTLSDMAAQSAGSASKRNIKALVGQVLADTVFWRDRLDAYLASRIALADFAEPLKKANTGISTAKAGTLEASNVLKEASELHLQVANVLRPGAIAAFSAAVLNLAISHTEAAKASTAASAEKVELLRSASDAVHCVSMALPHELLVVDCATELGEAIVSADAKGRMAAFDRAIVSIAGSTAETTEDTQQGILADLAKARGIAAKDDDARLDAFLHLLGMVSSKFHGGSDAPYARTVAGALAPFLVCSSVAQSILNCYGRLLDLFKLMTDANATVGGERDGEWSFCEPDSCEATFAKFMQEFAKIQGCQKQIKEVDNKLTSSVAVGFLHGKIAYAGGIQKNGQDHWLKKKTTKLEESINALKLGAGGLPDGADWDSELPLTAEWDVFAKVVQEKLIAPDNGDQLKSLRDELLKDYLLKSQALFWCI